MNRPPAPRPSLRRRGVIDKVISMILVMVVTVALGIFLYVSVFRSAAADQDRTRQGYEQEYGELLVNSLLLSHDNQTQMSFETLLSMSMTQMDTIVASPQGPIDVEGRFAETLDGLLGEDNYYFAVAPIKKGVAISYLFDGTPTMAAKREAVRTQLPALMEDLESIFGEDAAIYVTVYILTDDQSMCAGFLQDERQRCIILDAEKLYSTLLAQGLQGPYPAPFVSYSQWMASTHKATASAFGSSDWASAATYASIAYRNDPARRSQTNKHVIIAVADEMTTSSKHDSCFTFQDPNEYVICLLCNATCPLNRSERIINQTETVLMANGDLFLGFHEVVCDYQYNTVMNTLYLTRYTCSYLDDPSKIDFSDFVEDCPRFVGGRLIPCSTPRTTTGGACSRLYDGSDPVDPVTDNPPANVNWCMQQKCGGCDPAPGGIGGNYCFHTNCGDALIASMDRLSAATGGDTAPLVDLAQLTSTVSDYFDNRMEEYDFSIGVRNETRDRFVIERPMTFSDGTKLTLMFWIYD
jgi:hypothetical protein